MASKKIATNNSAVNQLVTMLTQAKPATYSVASASVDVPSHPYGTRRKIRTMAQLYDQTLPVLDNPLGSIEESPAAQTPPTSGSSVCGQLLKEQEDYSSDNSVPSSPQKRAASKTSSGVMTVMMTGSTSLEEQVALLAKSMEMLAASVKEKDEQIAFMMNKIATLTGKGSTTSEQNLNPILHEEEENFTKAVIESQPKSNEMVTPNQLKELIKEAIKNQVKSVIQPSYTYAKPYSQRIDRLRMPGSYQPPKFQQFDGKGNPRQHIAHFVETCNNAGTYDDLMVKQFVRSLKGNAFDWYTDLEPGTIDSWEQLEREFLNRFYSTRRVVSMIELTCSR